MAIERLWFFFFPPRAQTMSNSDVRKLEDGSELNQMHIPFFPLKIDNISQTVQFVIHDNVRDCDKMHRSIAYN